MGQNDPELGTPNSDARCGILPTMRAALLGARLVIAFALGGVASSACTGDGGGEECLFRVVAASAEIEDQCGCDGGGLICESIGEPIEEAPCVCVSDGASCPGVLDGGLICGVDAKAYLCTDGSFREAFVCPGSVCRNNESWSSVSCVNESGTIPYAVEGEFCSVQTRACTIARDKVLECLVGVWRQRQVCMADMQQCDLVPAETPGVDCDGESRCLGCGELARG